MEASSWRVLMEVKVPIACRVLDGKHISQRKSKHSSSEYYDNCSWHYQGLVALADASYRVLWIDFGCLGHMSDAEINNSCKVHKMLKMMPLPSYLLKHSMRIVICLSLFLVTMPLIWELVEDIAFRGRNWSSIRGYLVGEEWSDTPCIFQVFSSVIHINSLVALSCLIHDL